MLLLVGSLYAQVPEANPVCVEHCSSGSDTTSNSNNKNSSNGSNKKSNEHHDLTSAPTSPTRTGPMYRASYLRHLFNSPTPLLAWTPEISGENNQWHRSSIKGSDLDDRVASLGYDDVDNSAFLKDWIEHLSNDFIVVSVDRIELGNAANEEIREDLKELNKKSLELVEKELRNQLKRLQPFPSDSPEVTAKKLAIIAADEKNLTHALELSYLLVGAYSANAPKPTLPVQPSDSLSLLLEIYQDGNWDRLRR
jgi:hypothetical protein